MIFLRHDFFSNFNSGIESGDSELVSTMIINELSDLIVYKADKVIDLLNMVGVSTSKNASDETIVNNIADNIPQNIKLIKGLGFLIAENNGEEQHTEGDKGSKTERTIIGDKKSIDKITSGIIGIADSFEFKPQLRKEFKQDLMQSIATKSKSVGDRTRKHANSKNGKYVFLAVLIIGAAVGIYLYSRHKKKVAAEGTVVDSAGASEVTPTPTPEPVPAPTPEPAPAPNAPINANIGDNVVQ